MRLGEIDLSLKPLSPSFFLCKPDKTVIYPLKDIYNVNLSVKLGKINELTFTVPTQLERNHELIENPLIEKIRHRYLVKVEYNHQTEYFVFLEHNKTFDESNENISYKLFSLGFLLADKSIRDAEFTSETLSQIATQVLQYTNWKLAYVDASFDLKYRSHEIPNQTVLQALYELAEKYNALIIFDTVNLTISFYQPANVGLNKGLKFKEGKYLESFNVSSNAEDMVTRLRVYGNEGLTFRRLTPTGSNFLQDLSWFMYPFERDEDGNVIQHSDYMSDELCIALETYNKALVDSQGQFDDLFSKLTAKQDEIQQAEQELSVLQTQLIQIMDELDILNSNGQSGTSAHTDAVRRRNEKEAEINAKMAHIKALEKQETELQKHMSILRTSVSIETHLTPENLFEMNQFIIEKEYTNDTIVDEEDLLEDGLKAFNELREPKINMTLDIVNFLSVVEAQNDWNKLSLGDIVKVESKRLRVGLEAKIIEINYNFDSDDISLVIANEKELKDDYAKLIDLIYSASSTSTVVNMDKYKWDLIEDANTTVNQILNNAWDAVKRNITAGYKQSIEITERGLIAKAPEDPMNFLILQNGQLSITNDGGNTWKQSITKNGVYAERLIGKIILGSRLIAEDENGITRMSGNKIEIFDRNGTPKVTLGEYETNKYGLRVYDGAVDIRTSATNNRGVVLDKDGLRGYKSNGTIAFQVDNNGNATFSGSLNAASGTFSGNLSAAGGTFTGTLSGVDGTFTGTLSAVNGTFTTLTSGTLTAVKINSATINITEDVRIGNTIWLGQNSNGHKSVVFSTNSSVYAPSGTQSLVFESIGNMYFDGNVMFRRYTGGSAITVDFSGANVVGLNTTARFG